MAARSSPAPGIAWDASRGSWRVSVEVGTGSRTTRRRRQARFPDGSTVREMRAWQDRTRVELRAAVAHAVTDTPPPPEAPETLAQAADAYLETITAMPSYDSRRHDLAAWTQALGEVPVADLTPRDLLSTWNTWRHEGRAVSTLQHRLTALRQCLHLTAPDVETRLAQTIRRPKGARSLPRELPYATIRAILDAMPVSAARAMLEVMAETGLPPQTIRRMSAMDVDARRATMRLPPRQKGDGAGAVVLPLTGAAVTAWQAYRAQGWRPVSKATLWTVWARGCAATSAAVQAPVCSPYILRHSFAGRVLDATGGDLQALQALLQHEDIETSLQYTRARVARSVQGAVTALDRGPDPAPRSRPRQKRQ